MPGTNYQPKPEHKFTFGLLSAIAAAIRWRCHQIKFESSHNRGYDRPHRLTGNFVYELPFFQHQTGSTGKFFGGWQLNSFFTFQSGAPLTVTLGSDPTGSGNPIRPNLNTNLDLSSMTISEILAADGANLFAGFPRGSG